MYEIGFLFQNIPVDLLDRFEWETNQLMTYEWVTMVR